LQFFLYIIPEIKAIAVLGWGCEPPILPRGNLNQ